MENQQEKFPAETQTNNQNNSDGVLQVPMPSQSDLLKNADLKGVTLNNGGGLAKKIWWAVFVVVCVSGAVGYFLFSKHQEQISQQQLAVKKAKAVEEEKAAVERAKRAAMTAYNLPPNSAFVLELMKPYGDKTVQEQNTEIYRKHLAAVFPTMVDFNKITQADFPPKLGVFLNPNTATPIFLKLTYLDKNITGYGFSAKIPQTIDKIYGIYLDMFKSNSQPDWSVTVSDKLSNFAFIDLQSSTYQVRLEFVALDPFNTQLFVYGASN